MPATSSTLPRCAPPASTTWGSGARWPEPSGTAAECLAEQVLFGRADHVLGDRSGPRGRDEPPDKGGAQARGFSHHQVGCGGDLVCNVDLGDVEDAPVAVGRAA